MLLVTARNQATREMCPARRFFGSKKIGFVMWPLGPPRRKIGLAGLRLRGAIGAGWDAANQSFYVSGHYDELYEHKLYSFETSASSLSL